MAFLCMKVVLAFIISVNFDQICHVNFKNKPKENSRDQDCRNIPQYYVLLTREKQVTALWTLKDFKEEGEKGWVLVRMPLIIYTHCVLNLDKIVSPGGN